MSSGSDDERAVDFVDVELVVDEAVEGRGALREAGCGAGLLVVEEEGDVEAEARGEQRDGGEGEFEAVAGGWWLLRLRRLRRRGRGSARSRYGRPCAAGMPTHPPMTERMARMTRGKSMIQGDSWTPWACSGRVVRVLSRAWLLRSGIRRRRS